MPDKIKILGIAGSLRRASYNLALLRTAQQLVPADASLDILTLHGIPLFNQDEEDNPPAAVVDLRNRIRAADAILFATPEYNYSIPGVLKNAIDWASRPYGDSAWDGKPAAIIGASSGRFGTARAQYHLRQVLVTLDMPALNDPEVMLGNAAEMFDQQGNLTHESSRKNIRLLLENLASFTWRLRRR